MISRRSILKGLLSTPVIVTTPGLLMPVRSMNILLPPTAAEISALHDEWLLHMAERLANPPVMLSGRTPEQLLTQLRTQHEF